MRKFCFASLALVFAVAGCIACSSAQTQSSAQPASYGFRQRAVVELQGVQKEVVALAQAMPQDKYSWRPAEGVRSVAEVYLHITAANYGLTALAGVPPKAGFKFQGFEKSMTDKAQIVAALNDSFEYAENGIGNLTDADLLKPVKFQNYANAGDVILHIVAHAHEHLGQSIAYARTNGVVPPWTAERQAAQAAQAAQAPKQ